MAGPLDDTLLAGQQVRYEGLPGQARAVAEAVVTTLFRHRRLAPGVGACAAVPCPRCLATHVHTVQHYVVGGEPVHLVLPAFPAKSPSPRKVLGQLPDRAERLALRYLAEICADIREVYPGGARVTIASDGRVFSGVVGVSDADVTAYRAGLTRMIGEEGLAGIEVISLEDVLPGDFDDIRDRLCAVYAEPVEVVRSRARLLPSDQALYNGIHRFLFEDRLVPGQSISRHRLREATRGPAYELIRRSNAWSRLLRDRYPYALRLSIHPQPAHSRKVGILLAAGASDSWITPWHGVAVDDGVTQRLMYRHEAEALGATPVVVDGRPSHYLVS
jgi:pyoverdine/dityrosine biosynthesis protein Dit1